MGNVRGPDLSTLTKRYRFIKSLDKCSSQRHEDVLYLCYIEGQSMEEISRELDVNYKKIYGMRKAALRELKHKKVEICTGAKDYLERLTREFLRAQRLKRLIPEYESGQQSAKGIRKTIKELEDRCKKKQEEILKVKNELYQDILYMRYVEGYAVEDIAYDQSKTENRIYRELNRAIEYFGKYHMSPQ